MKKLTSLALLLMLALSHMSAQDVIRIEYKGTTATVNVPSSITNVVSSVNGANVTITSKTTDKEYTYQVKGNSTDGSLTINGDYKLTLQLAGVTLTNAHGGAAIDIECGKRIEVELVEGTTNTLCDAATGSQKAAFYIDGHAEFKGGGILNVSGRTKHAIRAKEYLELKSSTGTINVLEAVSDGIHCGKGKVNNEHNYFLMKGGIVNITNIGGDGIDSDDYGVVRIEGGSLSANIKDDASGLKADSTVTIKDGTINISVKGEDSKGIRANHTVNIMGGKTTIVVEGDGSKGIKAKKYESGSTVLNGGFLNISGGELSVQCTGGNLPDGTEFTKCVAVSVDANLKQTAGDVDITVTGPDAMAYTVDGSDTHTNGTFVIRQIPWEVAFIGDECVGYGIYEKDGYGVIRIRSNDSSAQPVTFKLYRFSDQSEIVLTPSKNVTFQNSSSVGEPSNPIVLSSKEKLEGDANEDGSVDVADIDLVIEQIDETVNETNKAADVNDDGKINVADVDYIIERIV